MQTSPGSLLADKVKFDWKDVSIITLLIFIFVFGIVGNSLVCYVFKDTWRKSTKDLLISTLAVVDLFSSVVTPIGFIYWQINGYKGWHFGKIGCILLPPLTPIPVGLSIGIILIISVNYCRVLSPFRREFKKRHIYITLFILTLICVLSELPYMFNARVSYHQECHVPNVGLSAYIYPVLIIGVTRDVIIIVTFTCVLYFVNRSLTSWRHHEVRRQSCLNTIPVIKMVIVMVAVFILLVFPRNIFALCLFIFLAK